MICGYMSEVKKLKGPGDLEVLIGVNMFKMKEEEIKENIRVFLSEMGERKFSIEEIRKMTGGIKGNLSDDIIKERERA